MRHDESGKGHKGAGATKGAAVEPPALPPPPPFDLSPDFIPAIVHEIVDAGYEGYYHNSLQRLAPSFNASWVVADILRMADWGVYSHDVNTTLSLAMEDEPKPAPRDAWARGSVPLKPRKKSMYETEIEAVKKSAAEAASLCEGTLSEGSGTIKSRATLARGSRLSVRRKSSSMQPETPTTFEIPERRPMDNSTHARELAQALSSIAPPSSAARSDVERDMREMALQAALEKEQQTERRIQELKGKSYTIDENGNVIPILQAHGGDSVVQGINIMTRDDPKHSSKKGRKDKRVKKDGAASSDDAGSTQDSVSSSVVTLGPRYSEEGRHRKYYKQKCSVQPRLTDGTNTMLTTGVSVCVGAVVKEGPSRTEDPEHMSLQGYLVQKALRDAENRSTASAASSRTGLLSAASQAASGRGTAVGGSRGRLPEGLDLSSIDTYSGARRVDELGPESSPTERMPDIDYDMTRAPDWGQPQYGDPRRTGPMPQKPTSKQKRNLGKLFAGGRHVQFPRDRLFPDLVHRTAEQTHLPIPPLGYVMGHGLPVGGQLHAFNAMSPGNSSPRSELSSLHLPLLYSPKSLASKSQASLSSKRSQYSHNSIRSGGVIKYHMSGTGDTVRRLLAV